MSLEDFIEKKKRELRTQGPATATKTGIQEAGGKAVVWLANWRANPIWAYDWDIALILDACRADLWNSVAPEYDLPTTTDWSVGSASVEWINSTFADRYEHHWKKTAYVTGNPHTAKDETFGNFTDSSVYPLKERGLPYLDEVWADQWHTTEMETVIPSIMTNRGMYAWHQRKENDYDRVAVHYMQPHIPLRNHPEWTAGWDNVLAFGESADNRGKKSDWEKLRDGEIPEVEFWESYRDNLRWVLDELQRWRDETDATILITSDHGNAAGEWGLWGHPPGNACPALREVPAVTIKTDGERKEIEPVGDPPVIAEESREIETQLEALGYK